MSEILLPPEVCMLRNVTTDRKGERGEESG